MSDPSTIQTPPLKAAELRRLPPEQRDAILAAAAEAAAEDYRNDAALTAFEAFGEEDLHVNSSDAEPR
jgi:acyl-CoA reductase-like NAD-dependent aldehyde dehydrogenase